MYRTDAFFDAERASNIEEAEVFADIVREQTGLAYKIIPARRARKTKPWTLRWMPQIGDSVCHSIGCDTHYIGKVTKITKTTFTAGGAVYRWSAKREGYKLTGCSSVYAHPGTKDDAKLDPHF